MTNPSQEAVEVDDFEVLICEVTKQLHVGTINAYEANKKLIGAYNKVRATFAQTIREETITEARKILSFEGVLSMSVEKSLEELLTPTTNHTGE